MNQPSMDTVHASDFALASCQATLFTPEDSVSSARIMRDVLPMWNDRYDGDPIALPPAAVDANRDLPRVTLTSASGEWRCEVASGRINLFWRRPSPTGRALALDEFYRDAGKRLSDYIALVEPRVGRVAAVVGRYAINEQPGIYLARHFCKEKWGSAPLNRPEHFELHAHKKFSLGNEYAVNSWVRCRAGMLDFGAFKQSVVTVEQDINTLAQESASKSFTSEEFSKFFEAAASEFDGILNLYFPQESESE